MDLRLRGEVGRSISGPMTSLRDADAIIVSTTSMDCSDRTEVVQSNVSFVNALRAELLTVDELAPDALRSYYVDYFHTQVMNGGFSQFVYNSKWNEKVVGFVRAGLQAMAATRALTAFESGERFVDRTGQNWLDQFLATDYFDDNPIRDTFDEGFDTNALRALPSVNARWLRAHPKLVVATIEDMGAEVRRRAAALPDRAERTARARANEPRDLRLIRALCERAGHELERRTAAALLTYEGARQWGFFFRTDRGAHVMIDLETKALMFPLSSVRRPDDVVDASAVVAEIACDPAPRDARST